MRLSCISLLLCLGCAATVAAQPEFEGVAVQGGVMRGKVNPGSEVKFNGETIRVSEHGNFIIGFGRDEPPQVSLEVREPGGGWESYPMAVDKREYREENIKGLPSNKVTPNEEELRRIKGESRLIWAARANDTAAEWFTERFIWPVYGRISGVYGSRRILNGVPKRPHFGVDVAVPTGTPIYAPAGGKITLAHNDMFYSGGTLIIDHGHGLNSTMMHLSRILVEEGAIVRQGDVIAEVGATGRATGPHLHWGMKLFKRHVDPQILTGPMPVALN